MTDGDNKILDAIIDLGLSVKALLEEQRKTNTRLDKLEKGFDKLEKQQANTNLALSEMRLSFMHYADRLEKVIEHDRKVTALERRVGKIERIVLKD